MLHCVVYKQINVVVIEDVLCFLPVGLCVMYNIASATAKTVCCPCVGVVKCEHKNKNHSLVRIRK
jgi:hypothetical protein